MTIAQAIAVSSKKLGTADGYLAVEALLAHILRVPREYLFSHPEKHIPLFAFFSRSSRMRFLAALLYLLLVIATSWDLSPKAY